MKKTKLLSLFLAVLMLCASLSLFASCGEEDGIVALEGDVIDVDVSQYALVYGDSQGDGAYTNTFRNQMDHFAEKLKAATDVTFKPTTMARANKDVNAKEILVGLTTRAESTNAKAEIEGDGFVIKVTENKIVIVGTSNLFTLMGVEYFTQKYLNATTPAKTLSVYETAIANEVPSVVIADSAKNTVDDIAGVYTYVHQDALGKRPSAYIDKHTNPQLSTYTEYAQDAIVDICEKMKKVSSLGTKYFPVKTDAESTEKEILIGQVNRPESAAALQSVAVNEFVVAVDGQKIVINGWSESTLRLAVAAYMDLITEGTVKNGDQVQVCFPEGFRLTNASKIGWKLDFPTPAGEGINLYNTMNANDNALQFLYTGTGVNEASYNAYCEKLKNEGYKVYMQSAAEGSIFTTFINKTKNTMLYVAYNAFAHKDDYASYDWTVSKKIDKQVVDVYKYDPCFRIVSAPLDTAGLPEEKLLSKQFYTKVTDSAVTTMPIYSKAVGLSYIVTLEDGSFVIFDGGGVNDNNGMEHEDLWRALTALHTEIYDEAPSTARPIRIAAWVLTHAHWDHYYAFMRMAKQYGSTGLMKVDYMIGNVPAVDSASTLTSIAECMTPEGVASLQGQIKGGFTYIKVHTGYRFHLANLEIEVITTWEDLNPIVTNTTNDSNTVLRFSLSNQDAPAAAPITQMWTGDANRWQSRFMCATYGSYLKSDMVSVAHHGNAGCEVEFYDMVSPEVIWWPHNATQAASYVNPANKDKGWQWEVDQHFYNNIASVKYVFTSGVKGGVAGDQSNFTTLKLTKNGPDYDGIYDVVSGEKLTYAQYAPGYLEACTKK